MDNRVKLYIYKAKEAQIFFSGPKHKWISDCGDGQVLKKMSVEQVNTVKIGFEKLSYSNTMQLIQLSHFDGTLTWNRKNGASFIPTQRPERLLLLHVTWVEQGVRDALQHSVTQRKVAQ